MMSTRRILVFCVGILTAFVLASGNDFVLAQSQISKLQSQIEEKNDRLSNIEKEIAEFEAALLEVGAEKNTLQEVSIIEGFK